jgi:uncharacterized membrane protein
MGGMDKRRVEAFSDGVLAVAITLLVLDLHATKGDSSLAHQLREQWPSFAAYGVSFIVVGVIWVNHNAVFALVAQVDRPLLFQNLILLMFVTTMPFTTSTLATFIRSGGADARWAVVLYGASNLGMALGFTLMLARIVNHGLLINPVAPEVGRTAVRRFGLGSVIYPVGTLLGLIWPPAVLLVMGAVAVYYMVEQTQLLPETNAEP